MPTERMKGGQPMSQSVRNRIAVWVLIICCMLLVVVSVDAYYAVRIEQLGPMSVRAITDVPGVGAYFAGLDPAVVRFIHVRAYREDTYYVWGWTDPLAVEMVAEEHGWELFKSDHAWKVKLAPEGLRPSEIAAPMEAKWNVLDDRTVLPAERGQFIFEYSPETGEFWAMCYMSY